MRVLFLAFMAMFYVLLGALLSSKSGFAADDAGYAPNFHEQSNWEFAGWYAGGCFPNIEFDPNVKNRVYLTSDVAGIWRSDDLGENWVFATQGLKNLNIAAVAVAPSDSNVLYAASADGIYVSRDAGGSWSQSGHSNLQMKFKRPQSYRPIAISSKDPLHVCVAAINGQVFCSRDGGTRWKTLGPGQQEFLTLILFADDDKIIVGGSSGLQIFDFTQRKWSEIYADLKNLTDFATKKTDPSRFYAAANGHLWVAENLSGVWRKSTQSPEGEIVRLQVADQAIFAAVNQGWKGKILVSEDQGLSWENRVEKIVPDLKSDPTRAWANISGKIASLKADPFDPAVMFRSDWWGVFRSDDGGKTWNEKIRGAPNSVGSDIVVTEEALLVATMDNGLLKSFDEGKSYHPLFPSHKYDPLKAGHVWRVIVPSQKRIVATSSPWSEKINQIIVSEDGGLNFHIVREGLPGRRPTQNTMWGQGYPRALAFDPKHPDKIYLGIDGDDGGGLFVSQDGGFVWSRSLGQPGSLRIYNALAVDPTNSQRIFWGACGKGGGVYVSADGGTTWRQTLKEMSSVFDLSVTSDGVVYASGEHLGSAVYVSDSHGENWKKLKSFSSLGAAEAVAVDPNNEKTIVVSVVLWNARAPGKIYLSQDSGLSWQDVSGNLSVGSGAAALAFSPDGKYLYASLYAGSVYRLRME